jgi:hypothetical protein
MRQFIIKQMHKRIMNADETANLEYPVWKRRTVVVIGFAALRLWSVAAILMTPLLVGLIIAVQAIESFKAIVVEIAKALLGTVGAAYRNLVEDVRGCTVIWNGHYGRGKLLPERTEYRDEY